MQLPAEAGRCPKRFHHAIECSVPDLTDPSLKEPVDQLQMVFDQATVDADSTA